MISKFGQIVDLFNEINAVTISWSDFMALSGNEIKS